MIILRLKLILTISLLLLITGGLFASEGWITNFDEAKKVSKETGKPILADFSGSDWCGWCIKLDKEVFNQKAFKDYAAKKLILFLADFPRKGKQSAALKKQNSDLAKKYGVRGFPTVLLLNSDGKVISTMGYMPGGAENYIKDIETKLDPKQKTPPPRRRMWGG